MTDANHLPLTEKNVRAVLDNPDVTFEDCDALYFSLCNSDKFGIAHPLVDEVLAKQGEIVVRDLNRFLWQRVKSDTEIKVVNRS